MHRKWKVMTVAVWMSGSLLASLVPGGAAVAAALGQQSTQSRTTIVTRANEGDSFQLRRGDRLIVRLSGPTGASWTEPTSSSQSVLHRIRGISGVKAAASFTAAARGRTEVSASGMFPCGPCLGGPILGFEVDVSVSN